MSKFMQTIREIFQPLPKAPPIPPPMPPLDPRPTRTERQAEMLAAQTAERLRREFDRMKAGPRQQDPWGES